ncbi:MAG: hypothetical protein QM658_02425 [Gordonia sp. (in: high G+C Gram-positive bacteria)]
MVGQVTPRRSALTHARRNILPDHSGRSYPNLRQVLADRREIAELTRDRMSSPILAFRFYAATTPGKLVVIMLTMILACGLTGWYSSSVLNNRSSTLESLVDSSEPLAEAAETLYSTLSVADAAANSAFISGGIDSPDLRQQYADAIATAGTALVVSANDNERADHDPGNTVHADLDTLATQIPVYTGLIETARTNNRLGNPVGSAYLVQASALMQDKILPAAERLYAQRSAAIAEPQRTLTVPPWGVYVALLVTIAMLLGTSRYLALRTRRHFNIGLVAALSSLLVGTLWLLVSGLASVAAANTAKTSGADPLHDLTTMRILTQQARSAETLSLLRRADPTDLERGYTATTAQIETLTNRLLHENTDDSGIDGPLNTVKSSLAQWRRAHDEVNERLRSGDFTAARSLTIGTGDISTATGYQNVNSAVIDAIGAARTTFRDNINTAQRLLGFTGTGIGLLCIVAAVTVFGGLIPRIREYR